ncbi:hypothetical protein [Natronomonas marina]|jgi:uncharacterized membrane protein|uniref:hypothetical protein n=1 Tax=Natronomonas marina TaxID=2961939 RepID=UPI0020CA06C3|nr:hypothetical protein [Natronomonas marina]
MLPLQFGIPGGPELLIVLLLFVLSLVVPFVLAYYIYTDAERRGEENGALWAVVAGLAAIVATPVGGLLVLLVYVLQRD